MLRVLHAPGHGPVTYGHTAAQCYENKENVRAYLSGRFIVSRTASLMTHRSLPSMLGTAGVPPVAIRMNLDCSHIGMCIVMIHATVSVHLASSWDSILAGGTHTYIMNVMYCDSMTCNSMQ